ncbi:MAG: condensation domain-containing protein, partial [Candidatus Accumulibacter sp.]|nr:condensation domain-containing protein [Accumulibacter sp.]
MFNDKSNRVQKFFPEIERAKDRDVWPVTFQEHQMAAEQRLRPDSRAYNVSFALQLSGALDEPRLERALFAFVRRRRVMRSRYAVENGETVRRLSDDSEVVLKRKSCRAEELRSVIKSLDAPFDLARGPLFRFFLIKLECSQQEHVLLLWIHHSIADGRGIAVFVEDLRELYENGGEYPESGAPQPDYLDYAVWMAERGNSEELREGKKFFLEMFDDGAPTNDMPIRAARPP